MNDSSSECSGCDFAVLGESTTSANQAPAAPPDVQPVDQLLFVSAGQSTNEQQDEKDSPPVASSEQTVQFNPAAVDFVLNTGLEEELSDGRLFDNGLSADSESGDAGLGFVAGADVAPAALTTDGSLSSSEHAVDRSSTLGSGTAVSLSDPSLRSDAQSLFDAALVQPVPGTALSPTTLPEGALDSSFAATHPGASTVVDASPAPLSSAGVTQAALAGSHSTGAIATATQAVAALSLRFEGNVGQFGPSVDYVVRGPGYQAGLHGTGATFVLTPSSTDDSGNESDNGAVVDVNFVGANAHATGVGQDQLAGTTNYLIGNDPASHFTDVVSYGQVSYHDVYQGIDVRYHSSPDRQLEYDFVVAPGADPGQVALRFDGTTGADLDGSGNLILHTAAGDLVQHAPLAYQQSADGTQQEVTSRFVLRDDGQVGFALGNYDTSRALVIDPTWVYSTFLGGSGDDIAYGVAVDAAGNAYVVGQTDSNTFRGVPNNDPKFHKLGNNLPANGTDAFVAKLSPDGNSLVYLTFIGGERIDGGYAIALANVGGGQIAPFITGMTASTQFYTKNAWQNQLAGTSDAFVTQLTPDGTDSAFSTYLGGVGTEGGTAIAVDSTLQVYIAGYTNGSAAINGVNPTKLGPTGDTDALVARLTAAGAVDKLVFLGGTGADSGRGIAVDGADPANIYVAGPTQTPTGANPDFPTTRGAYRTQGPVNDKDAFVVKIDPGGAGVAPTLSYSTLFGGNREDEATGIALDPSDNNVYVVGFTGTRSGDSFTDDNNAKLPLITLGTSGMTDQNAWVARFDANGRPDTQGKTYFAYIQGKNLDVANAVALAPGGKVYVAGTTYSDDVKGGFPTKGALQKNRGGSDAFLAYLDPTVNGAASLLFCTFIGGAANELGLGVAADTAGNAYVVGQTQSKNFRPPSVVPINGFDVTYSGAGDAFAVKIGPNPLGQGRAMLGLPIPNQSATVGMLLGFTVTATDPDGDPITYSLDGAPPGASIDPTTGAFTWTPTTGQGPAVYTCFVAASDNGARFDEQAITVVVQPSGPPNPDLAGDTLSTALPVNFLTAVKTEVAASVGDGPNGSKDVNLYQVALTAGQSLTADIDAFYLDDGTSLSSLDSYLRIFDATGTELAANDNGTDPDTGVSSQDSALTWVAPADGTYYVGVSGALNSAYNPTVAGSGVAGSTGAYHLQLTVLDPPPLF